MAPIATGFGEAEATKLLRAYGLRLLSLARIWKGTISENFRAETDIGPVFVRVSPGRSLVDAEFETQLIWHLLSHGLRTPALFQAHNRDGFVRQPGALAMVYEWVDGYERTDEQIDDQHAHGIGQLLGQLHLCTSTFPRRRQGIYTLSHIEQRLRGLHRHPRRTDELVPVISRLSTEAARLRRQKTTALPAGIGHCDLFPDNILFPRGRRKNSKGHELGPWMIDLEQAAWTTWVYDLAVSLLACTAPVPSDGKTETATRCGPLALGPARALIVGYQRMRLLSDAEWTGLYAALKTACVRFATTRITDVHLAQASEPQSPAAAPPADGPLDNDAEPETDLDGPSGEIAHSKDYRDYLYRLDRLEEIDPATLIFALRDR